MLYRYVVMGRGSFPLDMVRYDRAFFVDEPSSILCLKPFEQLTKSEFMETRHSIQSVTLLSVDRPTIERWKSFDWIVGAIRRVEMPAQTSLWTVEGMNLVYVKRDVTR